MASATPVTAPQDPLARLVSTARLLALGLVWGGIMLILLALWMRTKYVDKAPIQTNILLFSGIATLGLAGWQIFTLFFKKETPEQKVATLTQQRGVFSYVLIAGGFGLLVLAFILGMGPKPNGGYGFILDNFAESFSLLLFSLIALGGGYLLLQAPRAETASPIQVLTRMLPVLKMGLIILCIIALGSFFTIAYVNRTENRYVTYLPELAALFALSIVSLACILWLNTGIGDEAGTRLFVLVFGGAAGLILFLYSLTRAIFWREDIFSGGITAWQGENAWHFWLCAYLQIIALVLMFASFNLAQTDIRSNVFLRRVMYGYDTLVQALLVIEVLAVLNVVIYALMPLTYDWTKTRGLYNVSEASKNILGNLKKESHFIVLMSRGSESFKDVRTLMDNFQALSNKLQVEYVSPDVDRDRYKTLARLFPKITADSSFGSSARGVLVVYGPLPENDKQKVPYAFISEQRLSEFDQQPMQKGSRGKQIFKGETEIMREFKFLIQGEKKRHVYVLQGDNAPDINGERNFEDRNSYAMDLRILGFGAFVSKLKKDNVEVYGLSFGEELPKTKPMPQATEIKHVKAGSDNKKNVPIDCDTLIVAPGSKPLPAETVNAIDRFMERGGRMVVLLDVICDPDFKKLINTGLEPLLKRYGVDVTDKFALAAPPSPDSLYPTVPEDTTHPLARPFLRQKLYMPNSARILEAAKSSTFKVDTILELEKVSSSRSFTLTTADVTALNDPVQYEVDLDKKRQLLKYLNMEPVTVAAAVSETQDKLKGKEEKPRMVVIGDTEFLGNYALRFTNPRIQETNYNFAFSALEWLAEREGIGAQPKESPIFAIPPNLIGVRMILIPGWIMFLTLVAMGMCVWVVRRR